VNKDFLEKLDDRKTNPISVALIGLGQMGRGFLAQTLYTPFAKVKLICDINLNGAIKFLNSIGFDKDDFAIVSNSIDAEKAISQGRIALTDDNSIVPKVTPIEVILEATGIPNVAASNAFLSIQNQKHIVLLTVEADVVIGRVLRKMAESAGIVYTVADGDEPGVIKKMYDMIVSLGFDVVAAGKGKNNPVKVDATPDDLKEEAGSKKMNPRLLCSFVDGTKTAVEMTALSNATGLLPDIRGMHGPQCSLEELPKVLSTKEQGGILSNVGVVEYCRGVAPGVFVVFTTKDQIIKDELEYLHMGSGPNYVAYRPFHLTSLETLTSIYKAVLYNEPTIVPMYKPYSDTIAVAKRDLSKGEKIDGIGGFTVRGIIEKHEVVKQNNFVPISLLEGATVVKDISRGSIITFDQVKLQDNVLLSLFKLQEELGLN